MDEGAGAENDVGSKKGAVVCETCDAEMHLSWQGKVFGDQQTLRYNCPVCGGIVSLQRKGRMVRQIKLEGAHDEYRPQAYQAEDEVELKERAAFMVGRQLTPAEEEAAAQAWAEQQRQKANERRAAASTQAQAQAQAMAEAQAVAMQAQQQQVARAKYLAYARAMAARGIRVPPPVEQQVAYTLGPHARPVLPQSPAQLRARMLGGGGV